MGESRWPPVAAVLVFMVLNIGLRVWLPSESAIHVVWLVPALEGALLVVLLASDPAGAAEGRQAHRIALVLVVLLVALLFAVTKLGLPGWMLPVGMIVGGTVLKGWEKRSSA